MVFLMVFLGHQCEFARYIIIYFDSFWLHSAPEIKRPHSHQAKVWLEKHRERKRTGFSNSSKSKVSPPLSPLSTSKTLIFPAPITSFFRSSSTYRIFYVSIFVYVLTHMHQFFLFILYAIDVGFCWWVLIICLIRGKKIQEEMGNSVAFEDYKFLYHLNYWFLICSMG